MYAFVFLLDIMALYLVYVCVYVYVFILFCFNFFLFLFMWGNDYTDDYNTKNHHELHIQNGTSKVKRE